jgi:hypothetical protein
LFFLFDGSYVEESASEKGKYRRRERLTVHGIIVVVVSRLTAPTLVLCMSLVTLLVVVIV